MVNAYNEIISYKGNEWEDYLNKICLIDIFKELIDLYPDKATLKQVIHYILWCYSLESQSVVMGMDWLKNKNKIFDKSMVPLEHYEDLVLLKNEIVLRTIQRWINFQDSPIFSQLCMLKDLQSEMQLSANSKIVKSSGEVDYDQKFKNAEYVKDLRGMIRDCETELIANNLKLKEAYKDFSHSFNNTAKKTMGLETQLREHKDRA